MEAGSEEVEVEVEVEAEEESRAVEEEGRMWGSVVSSVGKSRKPSMKKSSSRSSEVVVAVSIEQ